MNKITVSDVEITDLTPKLLNKKYDHLLPKLKPEHISFVVSPVNNAISNSIRRTIACELEVKAFNVEYADFKTNDVFIIPEMVIKRFKMIPIVQTVPDDAVFELNVTNDTDKVIDIKSSAIKRVGKGTSEVLFDSTYTLFTLNPTTSVKISKITINRNFGFVSGQGMCVMGCHAVSLAQDIEPLNVYEGTGQSSKVSNPLVWKIAFDTNGTMPAKKIVAYACDNLISRLEAVTASMDNITFDSDIYSVTIDGESDTIGNLIMRTACELFPDLDFIIYHVDKFVRSVRIDVRYDTSDIRVLFRSVIKHLIEIYESIKTKFQ